MVLNEKNFKNNEQGGLGPNESEVNKKMVLRWIRSESEKSESIGSEERRSEVLATEGRVFWS